MTPTDAVTLPVFAIARHRLTTDGVGVSTLVGAYGCPLQCKYCLNPHAWNPETLKGCKHYTPEALYEELKIDHLYFLATNGGPTFGGGESLLHAAFLKEFRKVCGTEWKITAETSLNVSEDLLFAALSCVDDFIIDIKDMNPEIYQNYTGLDNKQVLSNLERIRKDVDNDRLYIRVPRIPNHQKTEDVESSVQILKEMGFQNIEVFPYIIR